MRLSVKCLYVTLSINDTEHNNALLNTIMMLVTMPNVIKLSVLNVIGIKVIILNAIKLNVLNVIVLSVVMPSVVLLSVMANSI